MKVNDHGKGSTPQHPVKKEWNRTIGECVEIPIVRKGQSNGRVR